MKTPKPPVTAQAPVKSPAPSAPQPTGLLSFGCLHCEHKWQEKRKPGRCPKCRASNYWLPKPQEEPTIPPLYYSLGSKTYHLELPSKDYLHLDKESAGLHLKRAGGEFMTRAKFITAIDDAFCVAQIERSVNYAGRLSGHRRGLATLASGARVLITSEANTPVAKKGEWMNLQNYLLQLTRGDKRQYQAVIGWLALARRNQHKGTFRPGQSLAFAGESNCGKSFFAFVAGAMLGGGSASCLDYMQGARFNDYLAEVPLWLVDDKAVDTSFRKRVQMGAAMKQVCVVPEMNIEGKGQKMFIAPTFRRLVLMFNRTAEAVQVHPELTEDIRDKACLILAGGATLSDDFAENQRMVREELPALCYFLDRWEAPKPMLERGWCPCPLCREANSADARRFGAMSYHNTELVVLLASISPDENLWAIIQQVIWPKKGDCEPWVGTSIELERAIDETTFKESKRGLTNWTGGFSATVGKLAAKKDGRIARDTKEGLTVWTLHKP